MRIAVTYEDGQIFQHFGHTERFKVYDVDDKKVANSTVINTNGSGHGALADMLKKLNVDTLICGGIGGGARKALDAAGIKIYGGAQGLADKAVEDLLNGNISYDPNAMCNHHGEHHHGGEHHDVACGEQGCGEHHCE
ncbi:MAG: NifB/NifX family molybdenum-iron cluster-binding protein [Oscillospiraceae bacterium]